MTGITIAGGVYREICVWPNWDQIYGSGGRAAAALGGHVDRVTLHTYLRPDAAKLFEPYLKLYGITLNATRTEQSIEFEYFHSLSVPVIRPSPHRIKIQTKIRVEDEVVLRFGMMEGTASIKADRCVYDPQSAFIPERFSENGSTARHLAIVANRGEVQALSDEADPIVGAQRLLETEKAEVVVVKAGSAGAFVVTASNVTRIAAYQTDRIWTIGSGDVFAAAFALKWGIQTIDPIEAARFASKAVAKYVSTMGLPLPPPQSIESETPKETTEPKGQIYLASPFFSHGQRWMVDEARRCLTELGLTVFSPAHDVGLGPAEVVGPADIKALEKCDAVFAVLDGLDSGTLFEVGYARARGIKVYALAQTVPSEDLKMVEGSGCFVFDDFVTALHHVAWRT